MNDKLRIYLNAYLLDLEYWCGLDVGSVNHYTNGTREFSNIKELCKYKAELAYLMEQKSHNGRSPTTENMMLVNEDKYTKTTSEEEVIQFISACWNKFGEHTATLVSAEQADIELFLARLKDDLDELRGNNKTLQAAIADKDAELARLLAVEVAAKKICNGGKVVCWCEDMDFDFVSHEPDCPVLVINPIGDK